jgi:hypothetical protein
MNIINLPERGDAVVTVCSTKKTECSGVVMVHFDLADVNYSLEEAVAIEGFLGFVHILSGKGVIHNSAVYRDVSGLPCSVVAVCFIKPKE